jgi:hypothetical protein
MMFTEHEITNDLEHRSRKNRPAVEGGRATQATSARWTCWSPLRI